MTNVETWAADFATSLLEDDEVAERSVVTTAHERLTIALIQARALECRQIAGLLQIQGLVRNPVLRQIHDRLMDRSNELEALGMQLAEKCPKREAGEKVS